jgi:hypothetical protein
MIRNERPFPVEPSHLYPNQLPIDVIKQVFLLEDWEDPGTRI